MNRFLSLLCVCVVLGFLGLGCSGGSPSAGKVDANASLGLSIIDGGDKNLLAIEKNVLEKEFLFQGSFAEIRIDGNYSGNPTSNAIKSKIVVFHESGDKILMIESGASYQPGDEYDSKIIVTSFPIIKKEGSYIVFDFNSGMTDVLVSPEFVSSMPDGSELINDASYEVRESYVDDVGVGQNSLTIKQYVSFLIKSVQKSGGFAETARNLRSIFYLTRYKENTSFVPVKSPGFRYLGYFEANAIAEDDFGTLYNYITRWDVSKPIKYYISEDVPEEYREAVKEGILYWNKAFGSDILTVDVAPEGVTAPSFDYNLIQWHTNNEEGSAYADWQLDPRTGEILHAQVYIASGWAAWTKFSAGISGSADSKNLDVVNADNNFYNSNIVQPRLCNLTVSDALRDIFLYRDMINGLSSDKIEKITKDVIRIVTAHEVGHTLGLRHNFAASTANTLDANEELDVVNEYLKSGALPADVPLMVNSVMEYTSSAERFIVGAMIDDDRYPVLPYDKYAIQWGYYGGGSFPSDEGIAFCTDHNAKEFADCMPFDEGAHLVGRIAVNLRQTFEKIPNIVAEAYISSRADMDPMSRGSVYNSTPYVASIVGNVTSPFRKLLYFLRSDLSLAGIFKKYPDISDVDYDEIDQETEIWLNREIALAGGAAQIFKIIDPGYFSSIVKSYDTRFDQLVSGGIFDNIPLFEGGTMSFSEDEKQYVRDRAKEVFAMLDNDLAEMITEELSKEAFKLLDISEDVEQLLADWARFIITSGEGLNFRFLYETRKKAAQLVLSNGPLPGWLDAYLPELVSELKDQLETGFGKQIDSIEVSGFPRRDQEYVAKELLLYKALASAAAQYSNGYGYNSVSNDVSKTNKMENKNGATVWLRKLLD